MLDGWDAEIDGSFICSDSQFFYRLGYSFIGKGGSPGVHP
jgi:hypothetical protein